MCLRPRSSGKRTSDEYLDSHQGLEHQVETGETMTREQDIIRNFVRELPAPEGEYWIGFYDSDYPIFTFDSEHCHDDMAAGACRGTIKNINDRYEKLMWKVVDKTRIECHKLFEETIEDFQKEKSIFKDALSKQVSITTNETPNSINIEFSNNEDLCKFLDALASAENNW